MDRTVALVSRYGRYGYRPIKALLRNEGWEVNHKRVERNLEAGGVESAQEAAQTRPAVVQRWLEHPASAAEKESCLEL